MTPGPPQCSGGRWASSSEVEASLVWRAIPSPVVCFLGGLCPCEWPPSRYPPLAFLKDQKSGTTPPAADISGSETRLTGSAYLPGGRWGKGQEVLSTDGTGRICPDLCLCQCPDFLPWCCCCEWWRLQQTRAQLPPPEATEDAAEEGGAASVRSHTGVVGAVLCRSGSLRVWKLKELSRVTQLEVGAGEGTCHLSVSHHCRAGTEVSKQGFPLRSQPGQTRQLLPGPIHTSTQDSCSALGYR